MNARVPMLAAGALLGGYFVLRPRLRRWGAIPEEVGRSLPGDDLIPNAYGQSTMATTIDAPPEDVWPWLVQMGCGRAGWYSYDRLDNSGVPSAERIVPEWQKLEVGDRLAADPRGRWWFTVVELEPERTLVLRSGLDLRARQLDLEASRPRWFSDGIWSFHLEELEGKTRLLVRTRGTGRPRALLALAGGLFGDPAHFVMQRKQFRGLKRRAERPATDQELVPA